MYVKTFQFHHFRFPHPSLYDKPIINYFSNCQLNGKGFLSIQLTLTRHLTRMTVVTANWLNHGCRGLVEGNLEGGDAILAPHFTVPRCCSKKFVKSIMSRNIKLLNVVMYGA